MSDRPPRHLRGDNLPPTLLPLWPLLWWLLLDRLGAPGWLLAAWVGASVAVYLAGLRRLWCGVSVDLLGNGWTPVWSDREHRPLEEPRAHLLHVGEAGFDAAREVSER